MNYDKIHLIEKYFKDKFNENPVIISTQAKSANFIKEEIDNKIEIKLDNDTIITKPNRKISLFSNKCKCCKKSLTKNDDLSFFYKYNYCYECYIKHEDG